MSVDVFDESFAGLGIRLAAGAVGMMPVHQRVVEADAHPLFAGSFHILPDQVPAGTLFGGTIICGFRIEMAEALVMFGGHHHVAHAGFASDFGPFARRVRLRLELLGEGLVFGNRDAFVFHHPFVAGQKAIKAPMNEHAESGFMPPFHAPNAIGFFGGWCVQLRGRRLGAGKCRFPRCGW